MEKDAITKDVSEDPREQLVNSILEKNKDEDDKYSEYMGSDPQEEEVIEPGEEVEDTEEIPDEVAEKPQDEMIEIVVDGEVQTVELSKVLDAGKRTMQKETAADKRLEEATKLLNEAKAQKELPQEDAQEGKPVVPKEIVQAIQYGTEEEAQEAVAQLIDMGRTKESVTPEDVETIVHNAVKAEANAKSIADRFALPEDKGGFSDIKEDPYLMNMAIEETNQLLASGEQNEWETYEKAGKKIRE